MEKHLLNTDYAYFELKGGILRITYKPGLAITLEVAKKIVETRAIITDGKIYPGLLKDNGIVSLSREAREYFASKEGTQGVSAAAIVACSVFSTFLGNFFIHVTVIKPPVPTKLFTDEIKALKWLEQYKSKVL